LAGRPRRAPGGCGIGSAAPDVGPERARRRRSGGGRTGRCGQRYTSRRSCSSGLAAIARRRVYLHAAALVLPAEPSRLARSAVLAALSVAPLSVAALSVALPAVTALHVTAFRVATP
jgi:hypothetical protein